MLYDRLIMTKNTMGTKLPRKLEQKMQIVGEQIKLARCGTCYLFSADRIPNRERCADCGNRNLLACAVCFAA